MKRSILLPAVLLIALTIGTVQLSQAQTVIRDWATLASDASPMALAIDASGNLYTANYNNNTISKVLPDGTVTSAWTTLTNTAHPINLTIDNQGNIYTANYQNFTISKISPSGTLISVWATLGNSAQPHGIVVTSSGIVYTANYNTNTVSKITPEATVTPIFASFLSNTFPQSIECDALGNVYTANYSKDNISKIAPDGTLFESWAPLAINASPVALAFDASGNLYTANYEINTVSKITPDGTVTQSWATLAGGAGPISIIVDASGNVYTANRNNTISKISSDGTVTQSWATLADNASPNDIAIDALGNIYTVNLGDNTISKIEPGSPLPTILLDFTGGLQNGTAALYWQSGVETNLNHYELEKSTDGKSFTFLSKIDAKGSNKSYDYNTSQSEPTGYYRLKMMDNDGHSEISAVVILSQKDVANDKFTIYPVPSTNNIFIRTKHSGQFSIYNMTGHLVKVLDLKQGLNPINISALKPGTYIGKINGQTAKFIKE